MLKKRISIEIKKGVNLIIAEPLWSYPVTRGAIILSTGAYKDPVGKRGLASVFSDVLNERSNLLEKLEIYGAKIKSHASLTRSFVSFAFLNMRLKKSFSLLSDFMSDFTPDIETFNIVKGKKIDRLSILEEDPEYLISRKIQEIMYPDSNLSNPVSGKKEDIENLTLMDIENYYKKEFLRSQVDIVIVSTLNWKRIQDLIVNVIEKFRPQEVGLPSFPSSYISKKIVLRKNKLGNVFVSYFLPVPGVGTDAYLPLKLISYVLGEGSFNSRLMKRLREDLGIAYYVSSGVSRGYTVNGERFHGYFEISAETVKESKDRLIKEIENLIKVVHENGIMEQELQLAKSYYIGVERKRGETYRDILDTILLERIYNLEENYFLNIRNEIENVTMNDVQEAMQTLKKQEFSRIILEEEKGE